MEWTERFATGVAHLDQQHRMLFQMVNDFTASLDDGRGEGVYAEFLRSLDLYARMHFGAEEECMFRFRCPVAASNAAAHQRFRGLVEQLAVALQANGYEQADARRAATLLEGWLVEHIGGVDTQLHPFVAGS